MTSAHGEVFTRLVHGIMGLGLLFLVLEVHQLRVAVEDVGLGASGDDRVERLVASLDQPLQAIGRQLGQVSEALERPMVTAPAMPAAAGDGTSHAFPRGPDAADPPAAQAERQLVATGIESQLQSQLQSQLASLVAAVQRIDRRPKVHGHSLPEASSPARGTDRQAVLRTLASLRTSSLEQSRFLTMTPKELLGRYGKPTSISIGEAGTVSWNYSIDGSWLGFTLYDGRVIYLSYP